MTFEECAELLGAKTPPIEDQLSRAARDFFTQLALILARIPQETIDRIEGGDDYLAHSLSTIALHLAVQRLFELDPAFAEQCFRRFGKPVQA